MSGRLTQTRELALSVQTNLGVAVRRSQGVVIPSDVRVGDSRVELARIWTRDLGSEPTKVANSSWSQMLELGLRL